MHTTRLFDSVHQRCAHIDAEETKEQPFTAPSIITDNIGYVGATGVVNNSGGTNAVSGGGGSVLGHVRIPVDQTKVDGSSHAPVILRSSSQPNSEVTNWDYLEDTKESSDATTESSGDEYVYSSSDEFFPRSINDNEPPKNPSYNVDINEPSATMSSMEQDRVAIKEAPKPKLVKVRYLANDQNQSVLYFLFPSDRVERLDRDMKDFPWNMSTNKGKLKRNKNPSGEPKLPVLDSEKKNQLIWVALATKDCEGQSFYDFQIQAPIDKQKVYKFKNYSRFYLVTEALPFIFREGQTKEYEVLPPHLRKSKTEGFTVEKLSKFLVIQPDYVPSSSLSSSASSPSSSSFSPQFFQQRENFFAGYEEIKIPMKRSISESSLTDVMDDNEIKLDLDLIIWYFQPMVEMFEALLCVLAVNRPDFDSLYNQLSPDEVFQRVSKPGMNGYRFVCTERVMFEFEKVLGHYGCDTEENLMILRNAITVELPQ